MFMRFIWTICVIGFLCMAILQATFLTMEYFEYHTFTSTGEIVMAYYDQTNRTIGTPDITLCNANPFASNRNFSKAIPTIEEYFKLVKQSTTCGDDCAEEERVALEHIRKNMMSTRGYFNYIGRQNARRLGHTPESFFAHCALDSEEGGWFTHVPCLPAVQMIEIQYTMLFNCYTIRLPRNKFPDKTYAGFLAVIHLDDYRAVKHEQSVLIPHEEPGQMRGVWAFAHQRHMPLYAYYNRILLQPGYFHEIPIKMAQRTYLPPPHGHCEKNMDGRGYPFAKCFTDCMQTHIYEQCGCLDLLNHTSQYESIHSTGPMCLSLSLEKKDLIRNWKCVSDVKSNRMGECAAPCPMPCKEMRYNLRVS